MSETKSQPISKRQVWEAYQAIKGNGQASGVDGISLRDYEKDLSKNLYKVWNRMSSGSYFPPPVREHGIPKEGGKERLLGIPTVGDRVAQMVAKRYMEPRLESYFHKDSYAYRPGRGCYSALEKAKESCWRKSWVIDLDIQGFFDNLDHELLMRAVEKHFPEKWVRLYVSRWLQASVQRRDGRIEERTKGTPQGGVISPLLANLYLHYAFDKWMELNYPDVAFERYADDIIVHCESESEARELLQQIRDRLRACKLELHPEKTKIVYCKQSNRQQEYAETSFSFLGYTFRPRTVKTKGGVLKLGFMPGISHKAKKRIYAEIRKLRFHRWTTVNLQEIAKELNPKLRGWLNYYGRYTRSALSKLMFDLNTRILKWALNRYKRFRGSKRRALKWLRDVCKSQPNLFAHWGLGFKI